MIRTSYFVTKFDSYILVKRYFGETISGHEIGPQIGYDELTYGSEGVVQIERGEGDTKQQAWQIPTEKKWYLPARKTPFRFLARRQTSCREIPFLFSGNLPHTTTTKTLILKYQLTDL